MKINTLYKIKLYHTGPGGTHYYYRHFIPTVSMSSGYYGFTFNPESLTPGKMEYIDKIYEPEEIIMETE